MSTSLTYSKHQCDLPSCSRVPPRLMRVMDAWKDLPPHVQETISLLAELKAPRAREAECSGMTARFAEASSEQLEAARREILRALRHAPQQYEWQMDADGCVAIEQVLELAKSFVGVVEGPELQLLLAPLGERIEISMQSVRATYGHSTSCFNPSHAMVPTSPLFHGTPSQNWSMIELLGLQPMSRRFVQLTTDYDYAREVASADNSHPLVLQVMTQAALDDGVRFFPTGTHVWLASPIPCCCLQIWGESDTADRLGLFEEEPTLYE